MKDRLPSLDGLRGIAALSVVLSHINNSPLVLLNAPLLVTAYQILAVGPNSVQILFVLSGFLMAYLYPSIPKASIFIKKRYARIFPIYTVIVLFLWLDTSLGLLTKPFFIQISGLFLFAFFISLGWKLIKKSPVSHAAANILFYIFIILQVVVILCNLFITPHFVIANQLILPDGIKSLLIMITNVTLTTPFIKDIPRMSGVFWSLAPEILFYIVYPFIVIPLVYLGRKYGIFMSIILIVGITKILFDLDTALVAIGGFESMNIARASGFVAGATIGTIYQNKGSYWEKIEPVVKKPLTGILAIVLFIAMQWGDSAIRDGQSILFMNTYYLVSSWIIAFVILTAIIPKTITYKILSNKVFVFLGLISYSLYLIHLQAIEWARAAVLFFNKTITQPGIVESITILVAVVFSIGIAWFLFHFIEILYFAGKKPIIETTLANENEKVKTKEHHFSKRRILITVSVTMVVFTWLYSGSFSPTQLVQRHTISSGSSTEVSLLGRTVTVPIKAEKENLSAISIHLRYAKSAEKTLQKKDPAILHFTLYDASGKKLFTSVSNAYAVEGSIVHGFGFPVLVDSKDKVYKVQLSLQKGSVDDQIFVDTTSTSLVSIYTSSKSQLLHKPQEFLFNRLAFIFTNQHFIFAIVFILFITFSQSLLRLIRKKE